MGPASHTRYHIGCHTGCLFSSASACIAAASGWGRTLLTLLTLYSLAWRTTTHAASLCGTLQIATAQVDDLDCWRVRMTLPQKSLVCPAPHSLQASTHTDTSKSGPAPSAASPLGPGDASGKSTASTVLQGMFCECSLPSPFNPALRSKRDSPADAGYLVAVSVCVCRELPERWPGCKGRIWLPLPA